MISSFTGADNQIPFVSKTPGSNRRSIFIKIRPLNTLKILDIKAFSTAVKYELIIILIPIKMYVKL